MKVTHLFLAAYKLYINQRLHISGDPCSILTKLKQTTRFPLYPKIYPPSYNRLIYKNKSTNGCILVMLGSKYGCKGHKEIIGS